MHYCLNVSCLPDGEAGGVLFRALEPVAGIELMAVNRGVELSDAPRMTELRSLTSGPGRLAEAFGIDRERDNEKDLTQKTSGLWIAKDSYKVGKIAEGPRIGITKDADHPLRYVVAGNPFVSGKRSSALER
jgi:DNA-3-methyladenine glycosylase